eukprot:745921-Hanusia_phi.AAC.1
MRHAEIQNFQNKTLPSSSTQLWPSQFPEAWFPPGLDSHAACRVCGLPSCKLISSYQSDGGAQAAPAVSEGLMRHDHDRIGPGRRRGVPQRAPSECRGPILFTDVHNEKPGR